MVIDEAGKEGRQEILALAGNTRSLPANMKSSCPSRVTKVW
jgi:hypothetical protein